MRFLLHLIWLTLCPLLPSTWAAPTGDELEDAVAAFRRAGTEGSAEERRAALERLVAFTEEEVGDALVEELARAREVGAEAAREASRLAATIEQRGRTLAVLELRAERDPDLETAMIGQREKMKSLEDERARAAGTAGTLGPWGDALVDAYASWEAGLHASVRKKSRRELGKAIGEAELAVRLAAVELLGRVGEAGTALELQKALGKLCAERASIERKLPRKEAELKKILARMQKEAEMSGGRISASSQYDAARREAGADRRALAILSQLCDGAVDAAASALARESGEELAKTLPRLVRAFDGAKDGARLRSVAIFVRSGVPPAHAALREHLAEEKDPATIAIALEEFARAGATELVPALLEAWLDHESAHVRAAAMAALARLRAKDAVPALIARLETVTGRERTDVRAALVSLTGQDFHGNVPLWSDWWAGAESGFVVPPIDAVEAARREEADQVGVTFFGITTESQRVLFVLDLSGSMNYSMVPRYNPADDPRRPGDLPRGTERSRLDEAKRALRRSIGGLREGALFNLVLYASDAWTWEDDLVTMDDDARLEVLEHVDGLGAVGGTNIFGALQLALEMAGADGDDEYAEPEIDTIFLLTDGRPSVGVTTRADAILEFVRDRNRSAGIVIHTIGLSGAQDAYLLGELAGQNDGTYVAR